MHIGNAVPALKALGMSTLADAKARSLSLPVFPLGLLADPTCGAVFSDQSAPLDSWFASDSAQ